MNEEKPKSAYAIQRAEWISQGLCGIDGKHKIWAGHSTCECRKHFLYFRRQRQKAAGFRAKKAKK